LHESRNFSIIPINYSSRSSNWSVEYMVQPCSNMYLAYLMSCFYCFYIPFIPSFCYEKIFSYVDSVQQFDLFFQKSDVHCYPMSSHFITVLKVFPISSFCDNKNSVNSPYALFLNKTGFQSRGLKHADIRGQVNKHFTRSFYAHRSKKPQKDLTVFFALLGSVRVKCWWNWGIL